MFRKQLLLEMRKEIKVHFLGRSQRNLIYIPWSSHVEKEKGNPPAPTLWCTTSETM